MHKTVLSIRGRYSKGRELARTIFSDGSLYRCPRLVFTLVIPRQQFTTSPRVKQDESKNSPSIQHDLIKPQLNYKYFNDNAGAIEQNMKARKIHDVDVRAVAEAYQKYAA